MFREKVVNLNEAVDMLRASEVAVQCIKEIDQGTSEEVVSLHCPVHIQILVNKSTRPRGMLLHLKHTLSVVDDKLFKAYRSVCSSFPHSR